MLFRSAKSKQSITDTTTEAPSSSPTTTSIKIVVEGANAIHDQNPVMVKLYTQLHQVLDAVRATPDLQLYDTDGKVRILVLDYDTTPIITLYDRGMLQLCDSTIVVDAVGTKTIDRNPKDVIVPSTFMDHNCKILRRFQI